MKNLYSKNEYLNIIKEDEIINEGFIGKMFKSLWKGVVKLAKKIKGSSEIKKIYDKYKELLDQTFQKLNKVNVADAATDKTKEDLNKEPKHQVATHSESLVTEDLDSEPETNSESNIENGGDKEQVNVASLSPEKRSELAKLTKKRIKEIKDKFEGEVNVIVNKLSKNPEYSSDKLKQFAIVMKNQFNSYVFDQWYHYYQNAGDKDTLLKVTKLKKQVDLKYKQSLQQLNSELGEKQKVIDVVNGGTYKYHSKANDRDIDVTVIGKGLGKDEKGRYDKSTPEHNKMWKVKHEDSVFWVSPSSFKGVVSDPTTEKDIKDGEKEKIKEETTK